MHVTGRDADESTLRDSQREDSTVLLVAKQETNMSKLCDAAAAVYDPEELENESVTNAEWWRGELSEAVAAVRVVISPWYLDELGNPTRTVRGM